MDNVNFFNEGRVSFKAGDWDKAIKSFKECLIATQRINYRRLISIGVR